MQRQEPQAPLFTRSNLKGVVAVWSLRGLARPSPPRGLSGPPGPRARAPRELKTRRVRRRWRRADEGRGRPSSSSSPASPARRRASVHPLGLGLRRESGHHGAGGGARAIPRAALPLRAPPPPVAGRGTSPAAAGARRWGREPEPGALMSPRGRRRPGAPLGLDFRYAAGSGGGIALPGGGRASPAAGSAGGWGAAEQPANCSSGSYAPSLVWRARVESGPCVRELFAGRRGGPDPPSGGGCRGSAPLGQRTQGGLSPRPPAPALRQPSRGRMPGPRAPARAVPARV